MYTEKDVLNMYVNDKQSISSISKIVERDFSYREIQKILKANNITIRGGRKKKQFTEDEIEIIKEDFKNGVSIKELAKKVNSSQETVKNYINENLHLTRTRNTINKNIKSDYFHIIDSPEKAYWIGLLFTDGSVRKRDSRQGQIRISLQAQDKEILETLRKTLNITSNLILDLRGNQCYSLEFNCEEMYNDLAQYNIIPNKTYNVKHLTKNLPDEYLSHFARGLFDGDGCLTYGENMSTDVTFGFTTYYESIAQDFLELIDGLIQKEEHNKPVYTNSWHINWRGYNQVIHILDTLYKDSTVHLERKYQKYQTLKNRKIKI